MCSVPYKTAGGRCLPLLVLLQALDKLQAVWEAAALNILEYRDTGTCVLKVPTAGS